MCDSGKERISSLCNMKVLYQIEAVVSILLFLLEERLNKEGIYLKMASILQRGCLTGISKCFDVVFNSAHNSLRKFWGRALLLGTLTHTQCMHHRYMNM